ncbi:MAG: D-arginine dehydrogenase [Candidatus Azotimanducaceae bacterium]
MPELYDIVVIGAGVAGASIAAELSLDCRVLLLEREKYAGLHATGRSAAYYAPSYGNDVVRQLTKASHDYFREAEVPVLRDRPALFIGTEAQSASVAAMRQEQPELKQLSFTELSKWVPALKANVTSGLLDTIGGDLDVDGILQGFLRTFKARGGQILCNAEVRALDNHQGIWHLKGQNLDVRAPTVINAAGAWADAIAGLAGLAPLGLEPKRRTALLVDGDQAWADWPLTIDIDEGFYFKPDAGQLLISPADETPSDPCDAQAEELDIAIAIDRVQQVVDIPIRRVNHRWAGLRTFAADKTFVIGFDPRATGFFWCAGQGGYGVQSAPGVASFGRQLCLQETLDIENRALVDLVAPARLF